MVDSWGRTQKLVASSVNDAVVPCAWCFLASYLTRRGNLPEVRL